MPTWALAKRGTGSEDVLVKVSTGIQEELGVGIRFDSKALVFIYKHFLTGVDETNAADIFGTYYSNLPAIALRLRLLLEQSVYSGLTCFALIGRALHQYPTFYWREIDQLLLGQFENFATARVRVAGNPYYGFSSELGSVKSTKYKGLTYVAIQLLEKLSGERSLRRYEGIYRST